MSTQYQLCLIQHQQYERKWGMSHGESSLKKTFGEVSEHTSVYKFIHLDVHYIFSSCVHI